MRTSLRWQPSPFALARPAPPPAGPALVQLPAYADTAAGTAATLDVSLPAPATAGSLIVVAGASDATLGISGSLATAVSAVNTGALYLWWKIAIGGEQTFTATPSVTDTVALTAMEYSGIAASSTVDQTVTATGTGSTTGPVSAGSTPSTAQPVDLVVAAVQPINYLAAAAPTAPAWTGGYTTRAAGATVFGTGAQNVGLFVADLTTVAAGAQTTDGSWTNSAFAWGAVIAAFRAA